MQPRDQWTSNLGFVLAAAGSAVGLGNLWKFPYITYANDGGAFVLVYLLCILLVGMPIMMAEIMVGRKTQKSPVGAMKEAVGDAWGLVGGFGVLSGFLLLGFYTNVAGWTILYVVECLDWSTGGFDSAQAGGDAFVGMIQNGGLQVGLSALFMGATVWVVSNGVSGGIERAARILLPVLFGILLVLFFNSLRMDGAGEAWGFIFRPNFSELGRDGVLEALGHSFFTLSLGMGAMVTYGSYMARRDSVVKAAGWVVILDTVIAMLATIIMFSVIFSQPGLRESVGRSTAGMLFITLPELFYTIVPMGKVLAPLFYTLVGFAALTSTVSLLEVVVSYFIDERGVSRKKASLICGGSTFGLSILTGLSFGAVGGLSSFEIFHEEAGLFATLDHFVANWALPLGGFFLTVGVGWFMPKAVTRAELEDSGTPGFVYPVWLFFIRFVSPVAVGAIILAVILGEADFN